MNKNKFDKFNFLLLGYREKWLYLLSFDYFTNFHNQIYIYSI